LIFAGLWRTEVDSNKKELRQAGSILPKETAINENESKVLPKTAINENKPKVALSKTQGYNIAKRFKHVESQSQVKDAYITLWLHQVHAWFKSDEEQTTKSKLEKFVSDAKRVGFTHLMFNLDWAWTEREVRGEVEIDKFNMVDVMSTACELGLSLHIVLSMRNFPPWLEKLANDDKSMYERGSYHETCRRKFQKTLGPCVSNAEVWKFGTDFVKTASELLLAKYGTCIASVSPTFNNEFETRYTQEFRAMRDYSTLGIDSYKKWQVKKGFSSSEEESVSPPGFPCGDVCIPEPDKAFDQWMGFREEYLADKYIQLCKMVKETEGKDVNGESFHTDCLLHIGEIYSSTDAINSNLFFKLAKSEFVDHLVMDSNMSLFGAPSSPSIIGILVSTAQAYGKSIHYEAATERILVCDESGKLKKTDATVDKERGVALLFRSGIARSLEAGVHSIGLTNLCEPSDMVGDLLSVSAINDSEEVNETKTKSLSLKTSSSFKPTAVIFVPYRAYYSINFVVSGGTCGVEQTKCWHESFAEIPRYGHGEINHVPGSDTCNVDFAQTSLISIWDDLRTRHSHVAVIADPERLNDDLLQSATERVFLRYPCVMKKSRWDFYEGEKWFALFRTKNLAYPFHEVAAEMPGSLCE